MNSSDFNKLIGLLSKLNSTAQYAECRDFSFKKYNQESIAHMMESVNHVKRLQQGLTTGKFINPDQQNSNTLVTLRRRSSY